MGGKAKASRLMMRDAGLKSHVFTQPNPRVLLDSCSHTLPLVDAPGPLLPLKNQAWGYAVVAITGPTAAGKSVLALAIAGNLDGEVVNYDSVQLYRGFDIGSGKLKAEEQKGIPHHLLSIACAGETMTAGEYRRRAQKALETIRGRRKLPVLAGGTGLYLRALTEGLFEGPGRSETLRKRLHDTGSKRGRRFLHSLLRRLDPAAAERIHPQDEQKVIRAIEVWCLSGEAISRLQSQRRCGIQGFRFIKVGLDPARSKLYQRINLRVERMFAEGLLEETRAALSELEHVDRDLPSPFGALGYRQAVAVLRGQASLEDAIRDTQTATRRYAKRQMTWFRKEPGVRWFEGFGDQEEIIRQTLDYVRDHTAGPQKPQLDKPQAGYAVQAVHSPERENT
jgi:tRNA dimethylallyltransferase